MLDNGGIFYLEAISPQFIANFAIKMLKWLKLPKFKVYLEMPQNDGFKIVFIPSYYIISKITLLCFEKSCGTVKTLKYYVKN